MRTLPFAFVVVLGVAACSSSATPEPAGDGSADSTVAEAAVDSALDVADTTVVDSSTDAAHDAPSDAEPCAEAGAIDVESCGKCGTRARVCGADRTWSTFGDCVSERGVCLPGETRSVPCGKCGMRVETCTATCAWAPSTCAGEGVCNPGDRETQYGGCTIAKEVKVRTCDAACAWSDFSACQSVKGWGTMATAPLLGRQFHTTVWTGTEMIVWGGNTPTLAADGAAYDDAKDTWRMLETAPIAARYSHTAVWTGSKMIVWGGSSSTGYKADGAIYDPVAKTWTTIAATTLSGRYLHTAVWSTTTNEMIVWGGYGPSGGASYFADGAAYDPVADKWRTLSASPLSARYQHRAVWAGGVMVIYGGYGSCSGSAYCGDAATYDPTSDKWSLLVPPLPDLDGRYEHIGLATGDTGNAATFWGGYSATASSGYYDRNTGASYDPVLNTWTLITPPSDAAFPYSRRYGAISWWGAGKLWIWGGQNTSGGTQATGFSYDPTSMTWTAMPTDGAPSARAETTAIWTGEEAVVWGGSPYRQDGKIFRP